MSRSPLLINGGGSTARRPTRAGAASIIMLAGLLGGLGPAHATVVHFLDEAALAKQSDSVVRGRVVAQSVARVDGRLWTDTTLEVDEVLKGKLRPGAKMLVRQPGGERDGVGMRVIGVARFSLGEEVVLFARWAGGRHHSVGMAQGKYQLRRDSAGNLRARRDLSGLSFTALDSQGRIGVQSTASAATERSLDELRAVVRAAGQGGGR
jgi:hypothetical protein